MVNLIKADMYRLFKDRILLLGLILAAIFGIAGSLMMVVLTKVLPEELLPITLSLEYMLSSSFALTNNFGFVIPIISGIFIGREFAYRTIHHKITKGFKRYQIYLSSLITTSIMVKILLTTYVLLGQLVLLPFAKFGVDFGFDSFLRLVISGYLIFLASNALTVFLIMVTRNQLITIIINLVIILIGGIVLSVLSQFASQLEILKLVNELVFLGQSNYIVTQGGYFTNSEFIKIIVSNICFIISIMIPGILIFSRVDIK